jgi:hypothetical protein
MGIRRRAGPISAEGDLFGGISGKRHCIESDIPDNSLAVMPHIFVGYDGKVLLSELDTLGGISLPWHGMRLSRSADSNLSQPLGRSMRR